MNELEIQTKILAEKMNHMEMQMRSRYVDREDFERIKRMTIAMVSFFLFTILFTIISVMSSLGWVDAVVRYFT
jgi:hypothetical protein